MGLSFDYYETAGFPFLHIEAFKEVSSRNRMVISSRELNPCCTDLLLEGYSAKGFHIKAKTCDWGPMAGFVPVDERFTKSGHPFTQQYLSIQDALGHRAGQVPLIISTNRLNRLRGAGAFNSLVKIAAGTLKVTAHSPDCRTVHTFVLSKRPDNHWFVCYADKPVQASCQHTVPTTIGTYYSVIGLTNPSRTTSCDFKAAVCGDYDLWCVFPYSSLKAPGINDRAMPLRATLVGRAAKRPDGKIASLAQRAELVFNSPAQIAQVAATKEDKQLGNISAAINRIRTELNTRCRPGGPPVVMHSDYGGHPFGIIDYPIIFFIPIPSEEFRTVEHEVARNILDLRRILKKIEKFGYRINLNPAWTV